VALILEYREGQPESGFDIRVQRRAALRVALILEYRGEQPESGFDIRVQRRAA
jgi:primosomal replication protein N